MTGNSRVFRLIEQYQEEAKTIPFEMLQGRHVYVIGKEFLGLSTRRFRQLLTLAGAVVEPGVSESTELVAIGEQPSKHALLRALNTKGTRPLPLFVKTGPFAARFWPELVSLKVAFTQTFGEHLAASLPDEDSPSLSEPEEVAAGGSASAREAPDARGSEAMDFVWIAAGTFVMGSSYTEDGRLEIDGPPHQVTITRGFWLGRYAVTQKVWVEVMGTTPWAGKKHVQEHPNCPAVCISWNEVQALIQRLNESAGAWRYRLPTEAEWEYACRAGTTSAWSMGDDESQLGEYAWYGANAWDAGERYAHEVGTRQPNPWGLYDMHGNVYEWVQDWYGPYSTTAQTDPAGPPKGAARIRRGGSFYFNAQSLRSAFRSHLSPRHSNSRTGVRLVRVEASTSEGSSPDGV